MKIRTLFAALSCLGMLAANAQEWDFRDGNLHGFAPVNFIRHETKPEVGFFGVGHVNAYFYTPVMQLTAADYKYMEIGLEAECVNLLVYFSRPDKGMSEATRLNMPVRKDKKRILFTLTSNAEWKGIINRMRFDIVNEEGRTATVRYIKMMKTLPRQIGGMIENGNFVHEGECWEANGVQFRPDAASIPANGELTSQPIELPVVGAYLWEVKSAARLNISFTYYDIFNRKLEDTPVQTATNGRILPPQLTASVVLHIQNPAKEPAIVQQVIFDQSPFNGALFRGKWLWNKEVDQKQDCQALFRYEFDLKDLKDIKEAKFYVTADDQVESYLNDTYLCGVNSKTWRSSDSFFVTKALRQGKNSIVMKVTNQASKAGVIADLELVHKDGTSTFHTTSEEWKTAVLAQDDNKWKSLPAKDAPIIVGENGCMPWGEADYKQPQTLSFAVSNIQVPRLIDENTTWAPKPILVKKGQGTLDDTIDFTVRFVNEKNNFLVLNTLLPLDCFGKSDRITVDLAPANFRYIPDGEYKVQLTLSDLAVQTPAFPKVIVKRSPAAKLGLAQASVVTNEAVPQVVLDGKDKMTMTQYLVEVEQRDKDYREQKLAFDSGVPGEWIHHIVSFDQNGDPDFTNIDNICTTILTRNPNIHIILITCLDCILNRTMTKFLRDNPDAAIRTFDGDPTVRNYSERRELSPSFASEKWLQEGDRILTLLINHLKEMPYGRRVAAVLPSAGITWEWMYWGSQREGEFLDYSIGFRLAFANFAKARYGTIEETNRIWHKDFTSFEDIIQKKGLPTPDERKASPLDLRIPEKDQYIMDYNRCMATVTSDAIIRFCKTVKRVSEGKLLSGAYYGYYNMITHSRWAQNCGHWALSRTLASDAVDLYHSPTTYQDRAPGGAAGFMLPTSSLRLNGKVYTMESDIRTHYTGPDGLSRCDTLQESRAVLEREVAACLANQVVMRYYDFSLGWVFRDPRYAQMVQSLCRAEQEVLAAQTKPAAPANSIAVVISENSMEHISYQSQLNTQFITRQYTQLPRTGVPFDCYITPGLEKIPLSHKCWFFENPFKLSAADFEYIKKNILIPGNTVIFGYGADVIFNDHIGTEHLEQLTGMKFLIDYKDTQLHKVSLTPEGIAALDQPNDKAYGHYVNFKPIFRPVGNCTILAKDEKGQPVLAENTLNGCRVIFTAQPKLLASWLRNIAVRAGLHCFNRADGDITWASTDFMGFHFPFGGHRTIHTLRKSGIAKDLVYGTEYPIVNGTFEFDAPKMSSSLFLVKEK